MVRGWRANRDGMVSGREKRKDTLNGQARVKWLYEVLSPEA